jgi:polysaccharide export outer membrane protein
MKWLAAILTSLALAAPGVPQTTPWRQAPATVNNNDGANLPVQRIGRDDLLGISVYDAPELSRTARVAGDGSIRLPMLKARIPVAGLYPPDVETAIAVELVQQQLLVDPIVTVSILEYRSRPISVGGAVRRPLTFQATESLTLLDALARAEGLSENAGAEILISKLQPAGPEGKPATLLQRVPVSRLIDAADPEVNLRLDGGEEIRVPEAGRIYVVGNVKKPGAFPIKDGAESSLLKALALSEGLLPYTAKTAYIYRLEGGAGGKNEIPVELSNIIDRKASDVPVLANDIVYIPDNRGRRDLMNALKVFTGIGGGVTAALIYALTR